MIIHQTLDIKTYYDQILQKSIQLVLYNLWFTHHLNIEEIRIIRFKECLDELRPIVFGTMQITQSSMMRRIELVEHIEKCKQGLTEIKKYKQILAKDLRKLIQYGAELHILCNLSY